MGCLLGILRLLGRMVLGLAILAGLLHYLVLSNFTQRLVDAETYTEAINETDAYNRVYDEVLVDDALQNATGNLLGGVDLGVEAADNAAAVDLLREIMPPSYLREQAESNIARFTAYLRVENGPLRLYVDLKEPLARIQTKTRAEVDRHIDALAIAPPGRPDCSPDTLRQLAAGSARPIARLSNGEIPQSAPSLRLLTRQCRQQGFDRWFDSLLTDPSMNSHAARLLEQSRADLRQSFIAGDTRDFLKTAAAPLVDSLTDDAVTAIRRELPPNDRLDLIQRIAEESADFTEEDLQNGAAGMRELLALSNGLGRVVALIAILGGLALLALLHLPKLGQALRWPGVTLLAGGAACLAVGYLVSSAIPGQLNNAITSTASYSADVPGAAINLAGDLLESFGRQATAGFRGWAIAVTLLGAALVAASFVADTILALLRRLLPFGGGD